MIRTVVVESLDCHIEIEQQRARAVVATML
jgi:hypothetical protein